MINETLEQRIERLEREFQPSRCDYCGYPSDDCVCGSRPVVRDTTVSRDDLRELLRIAKIADTLKYRRQRGMQVIDLIDVL